MAAAIFYAEVVLDDVGTVLTGQSTHRIRTTWTEDGRDRAEDDSENTADTEEIRGMNALLGMELVEWRDGYARTEIEVGAKHLNHVAVHGALSLALLDVTSVYTGWAPRDQERARCVTLSLTTNFIGKAPTVAVWFARLGVTAADGRFSCPRRSGRRRRTVGDFKSTHRVRSGSR